MAAFKSTQITKIETVPFVKLARTVFGGKAHLYPFDYTAPSSSPPASGDNIRLTKIPAGVLVVASFLAWGAQASGATLSLGITGTVAKYMAAQTMTAAGVKFGPTLLAESNLVTAAEEEIIGTLATAGFANSGAISGWLLVAALQ